MKENFSKKAKRAVIIGSLSCFLCSSIGYVFSMEQVSAQALDTKITYENQLDNMNFNEKNNSINKHLF